MKLIVSLECVIITQIERPLPTMVVYILLLVQRVSFLQLQMLVCDNAHSTLDIILILASTSTSVSLDTNDRSLPLAL